MKKLKLTTVVGTRPEIIRLSRVILALDKSEAIEHILIHTGQNYDYELNEVFFEDLGLRKPDYFLNAAGGNATVTAGKILIAIDPILEEVQPDAFLVLGDTNSCLCAIAAKKRHIPIFHMEAGNRCFDQRVPEETNRKIVDHTSDINMTYSSIAREYLLKEGLPADRIIKTGSPMFEVLHAYMEQIDGSDIIERLNEQSGLSDQQSAISNQQPAIIKNKYFVVSAHREENINSDNFIKLLKTLNILAEKYQYPIIVSTHPRTRNKLAELQADSLLLTADSLIQFMKPLGFHDYNHLQKNAYAVLSDSGTISEESSIMNFPALNIRDAHERPEAMEEASVMMVGMNTERILQGITILESQKRGTERDLRPVYDYSMPNVSEKVVRIVVGYTDYVKRVVWNL